MSGGTSLIWATLCLLALAAYLAHSSWAYAPLRVAGPKGL
jgi:threonine/homoserine/homoserine lactone efflux protein